MLGADDIIGELAERYGYVNRSLPDAKLDGLVETLATRISSFDKQAIAEAKRLGTAYVPFFPLGGFTPLQSSAVDQVAASLEATPMQVALAWLLQRSPNILLIPGTSSVDHLHENLGAAALDLPPSAITKLEAIDQSGAADHSRS